MRTPTAAALLLLGVTSITVARAQSTTDPGSASTPHQRDVTGSGVQESMPANGSTSPAAASTPHQRDSLQNSGGPMSPADFVTKAGMDGMTEVQVAQLALQKSQNTSVKQFAQQMVTDHTKANDELKTIGANKGLTPPAQLDGKHQAMVKSLSAKSGADFDSAYVGEMATAHDKAIALFTSAKSSSDPDIAAFASKTLPTLQMHKKMVTSLQANASM